MSEALGDYELEKIADSVSHEMSSLYSNEEEGGEESYEESHYSNDSLSLPASLVEGKSGAELTNNNILKNNDILTSKLLQGEQELALSNIRTEYELKLGI